MQDGICVTDHGTNITIGYDDLLKYHGRTYIAGVAMAYKLMELAVAKFSEHAVISRENIKLSIGVNGPGIIDAIEMITRAKSHDRLTVDQKIAADIDAPDAADGQGGKYYFEMVYCGRKLCFALKHGIIPSEFIDISYKYHAGSITYEETIRLKELKEAIASFIMGVPAADLFTVKPG